MPKTAMRIGCWILMWAIPLQMFAADSAGILTGTGTVLVDHQPAASNSAVFAGSMIQTTAAARAVISGRGSIVTIPENSMVRYGTALQLDAGAISVSTTTGMQAKIEDLSIVANPGTPIRYVARRLGDQLQVAVLEGEVYVSDGQQTTPVPATKGVSIPLPKIKRPKVGWLKNDDLGLLLLIAAGVAAGVTIGVLNSGSKKPVSPSVP